MKEVLSLPAGGTITNIRFYRIHAFPFPRIPNYENTKFVTFRAAKGGEMDMLYTVVSKIVLNPFDENLDSHLSHFSYEIQRRVSGYIQARKTTKLGFEKKGHTYMFYILKEEQPLYHKPSPLGRNSAGHTYYTYGEITDGKKEITVQSKISVEE